MKSVISLLQQKQLEKNNQAIVTKHMLLYKEDIGSLTIRQLAERAFVSTATVSRLAQSCGFKGYTELKYQMMVELEEVEVYQNEYISNTVDNYLSTHFNAILNTTQIIDYQLIIDLANSVFETKEVIIFATGATLLRAMDFEYKLRRIGIRVISCMDFDQQLSQSKIITNNTTCIAISYGGDAKNVLQCISNIINRDINCYYISTVNNFGNVLNHIEIYECEPLSKNYAICSSASISCVLDLIFLELVKLNPDYFNKNLESISKK